MLSRLTTLAAACALAAALPAAAHAAVTQVLPLESASNGVAVAADGKIHVIEPLAGDDAIFNPDGTRVATGPLPAGATNATRGPDGNVWVTTPYGFTRVLSTGAVSNFPNAFGCAPAALASDGTLLAYTAPDAGACGTHGLGELSSTGSSLLTDTTFPDALGLAFSGGKLFAPVSGADTVNRYRYNGSIVREASIGVPAGSGPGGIAAGQDGKMYVSLYNSGQVVRFDPAAADGTAATVVASGLGHPYGVAAGPMGDVTIASHDDGRLVRVGPPGVPHDTALPAGFHPQQVAISGNDTWVTDDTAARVGRVVDDRPTLAVGALTGSKLTLTIDPEGNETDWSVVAMRDGTTGVGGANGVVPAGVGPVTVTADLSSVAATAQKVYGNAIGGDYTLFVSASNRWGGVPGRATDKLHLDSIPPTTPPATKPPGPTTVPKAKAPRFDELVKVAATRRCVVNRRVLLLSLRRQPGPRTIAWVTVKVGKGKAHKYLARQLKHGLQLRRLPAHGSYKVAVTVRLANGKSYKKTLTYRACKTKRR